MPAAKAEKNLISYFNRIPTHSVNAFHEPFKGPHGVRNHMLSSLVQYDSKNAQDDINSYYDSVPSHNVNAYHDAPSHLRSEDFLTEDAAGAEMNDYYDSLPTRTRQPTAAPPPQGSSVEEPVSVIQEFDVADTPNVRPRPFWPAAAWLGTDLVILAGC